MPEVQRRFPLAQRILEAHADALGPDFQAYRNHVHRLLNYFQALAGGKVGESVLIAAAFHDLAIWTHQTFDYIEPSVHLAAAYLQARGQEGLEPEVATVIREHHKLWPYRLAHSASAEIFRKADLVDLSLGKLRFGLDGHFIRAVRTAFPNQGFHRRLVLLTARQCLRTPWRPLPMVHW